MNTEITRLVRNLNPRTFVNDRQVALYDLIVGSQRHEDGWVPRSDIRVPVVAIRDLRRSDRGGLTVLCRTASKLGRNVSDTHLYRLSTRHLTVSKIRRVFGV